MAPKNAVAAKAREFGATFAKVRTKKVSFADLARAEAKFIKFDGLHWSGENKWDELKAFAKANGFILTESI